MSHITDSCCIFTVGQYKCIKSADWSATDQWAPCDGMYFTRYKTINNAYRTLKMMSLSIYLSSRD